MRHHRGLLALTGAIGVLLTMGLSATAIRPCGPNKVTVWSYPIISNGLIYVVDIRNGLYVLRYTATHAAEAAGITFLEGNSNLGDAVRLAHNH